MYEVRVAELRASGAPHAIRFKVPEGTVSFNDAVHGPIAFEGVTIEDFVIKRSDGYPTYHLSVVVDDAEMGITQVVRGDDHISNTPKHVLLFTALGAPVPEFAHVPLIVGTDKKAGLYVYGLDGKTRDFLDAEAHRTVASEELERLSGLDRFALARHFRTVHGTSSHRYQVGRRLLEAQRLIAEGMKPAEAAATTGFADQSHLTRHFASRFGVTPGRWATLARA